MSVAGVVPCAGRSSRMGHSKALLDAAGSPFLTRVVAARSDGGARPVMVVVRDPTGAEADLALQAGARVLLNPAPDDADDGGPISSLRVALRSLEGDVEGLLVLPVDHPRVEATTVERLIAAFRADRPPVVAPRHDGRTGHPVLFGRSVFDELLEPGLPRGARTVVDRYRSRRRVVDVDDPGVVDDLDTREQYLRVFPSGTLPREIGAP